MDSEVSLRPLSLKPGGGKAANPFAVFGKGAGSGIKKQVRELPPYEQKPKKPASEIVSYSSDFLLKFSERFTKAPEVLESHPDIVLDTIDTSQIEHQKRVLQAAAEEIGDSRDWRARGGAAEAPQTNGVAEPAAAPAAAPAASTAPAARAAPESARAAGGAQAAPAPQQAAAARPSAVQQAAGTQPAAAAGAIAMQMQRAADVGRQAWAPATGAAAGGVERAIKAVKGILNKLTPEKFDRLFQQLVDTIKTAEVLHATIQLVFENAVAQPTFCALYAELCNQLSKELPQFPPPPGESKPVAFRKVLLNTCQEEFEGAAQARQAADVATGPEKEAADRRAKQRMLGNIRLIGELFKKQVVTEMITRLCIQELMGDPRASREPHEDNVEAICELLTIAGKSLDEASPKSRERLAGYFATLDKWQRSARLASRIRFMVKDVVELRRSKWIPRREQLQAKKLDEIHAEAHAELGMVPATLLPALETLQPLPKSRHEEVELFPGFKGGEDWQSLIKRGGAGAATSYSALTGEYKAPASAPAPAPAPRPAPAAAQPAAAPQAPVRPSNEAMSEEDRDKRATSLFSEYISSADLKEAITCAQELASPEYAPKLLRQALQQLFDVIQPREQELVIQLVVALQQREVLPQAGQLQEGLGELVQQLEDLSLDVPAAPKLLGQLLGQAALDGAVQLSALPGMLEPVESCEPKRKLVAGALQRVKAKGGADKLKSLGGGLQLDRLLKADPEFDGDLPSVADFLKIEGLEALA